MSDSKPVVNMAANNAESNAINKYLKSYAEKEATQLLSFNCDYDCVCVIPVCNEFIDCLSSIFSKTKNKSVLIIVVVNCADGHVNSLKWSNENKKLIHHLKDQSTHELPLFSNMCLLNFVDSNDVLLVDKNSEGDKINHKQGVGLARKIGADIALKLYCMGWIKSPWIYSTDADVVLPDVYFDLVKGLEDFSALVVDFKHVSNQSHLNELQYYYDLKLRYYHAGIVYSGSYYDYIPMGSTVIINIKCYAQVRGFPKKSAGEDFYLLNKLAKVKPVKSLVGSASIEIESRFSDRVPFGTGPALIKINALQNPSQSRYYHPMCFIVLKNWMVYLNEMWRLQHLNIIAPKDSLLNELYLFFKCQSVFNQSSKQITSHSRWKQFLHQWFDAFKTLKAIHYVDKKYPRQTASELKCSQEFVKVSNPRLNEFMKNDKT